MAKIWNGSPLGFTKKGKPIDYDGNAPTLIVGPQGSNKTVGYVCNALLDDDTGKRSYFCFDPKGEVDAVTSKFRASIRGHKVYRINPYGVLTNKLRKARSNKWNPLKGLHPNKPGYGDAINAIAAALIPKNPNETQPFFPNAARSAVAGTINFEIRMALKEGRPPSLPRVREILTLDRDKLAAIIKDMIALDDPEISTRMRKFLDDSKSLNDIKANVEADTAWMSKEICADMVTDSGVNFDDFATHKRGTTIYFTLPPSELKYKGPYVRLVFAAVLRSLYRHDGHPATLIIDEGFVLGYHEEVEQAASILRGYGGSRFSIVFQSWRQAVKLYAETAGLFSAGAVLSFRPADIETGRWLVERAGFVNVVAESASDPSNMSDTGARSNYSAQKRERIPLAKMFGMPQGRALVWLPGDEAPRVSWVKGYFEIPKLARRASRNPYYRSPSIWRGRMVKRLAVAGAVVVALIAANHLHLLR